MAVEEPGSGGVASWIPWRAAVEDEEHGGWARDELGELFLFFKFFYLIN